jgi:transposase
MQMKEKVLVCLTGLLLGTNHGRITTNPNQSVLQWNGKFKFTSMSSAGKVTLTVFWESQGALLAYFQKRCDNENSASHCVVLLKLPDAIRRKHPGQLARGVQLHHDNARPHTARATEERIQELQWELLEHPPYSPDLGPYDLHLFGPLKNHIGGKRFAGDEEVETEVRKWLIQQSKYSYLCAAVSAHW